MHYAWKKRQSPAGARAAMKKGPGQRGGAGSLHDRYSIGLTRLPAGRAEGSP